MFQNLDLLRSYRPKYVLILAGDHVYKMDYGRMLAHHIARDAVCTVARSAQELGWRTVGVCASPLPGPSGNVEYFLWLRAHTDRALSDEDLERAVHRAVTGARDDS